MPKHQKVKVVDLFCGIGGLSHGMKRKGFNIIAGFDIDDSCKYSYESNNDSTFFKEDIKQVKGERVSKLFGKSGVKVLAGCAPCQPFSSYAFKMKEKDKNKYDLLYEFGRLVEEVLPDIVTMENVAQILSFKQKPVLNDFVETLKRNGYHVCVNKVFCPDYGIPQTRTRLVLLASRFGQIDLIPPTHSKENYVTVFDTIGHLPPIKAGEISSEDMLHRARSLSDINLRRIEATPASGSWKDWSEDLHLECHKKSTGKSFGSVYGRMTWDKPAPTMTTLCTGLGNGRFGHPEQDRAISLREAALFQTFPEDYHFFKPDEEISVTRASRYIGNAVPPRLGEITALSITKHLEKYGKARKRKTKVEI